MSRSVFALMVCVFGVTTGEFVIAGLLPDIAAGLAVPIPAAGLLVTAYALGMIVGGPLLTIWTASASRKPLLAVLLVVAVVGNLASAFAPSYPVLFAARIATALVTATFFASALVVATSTAPAGKQASTVAMLALGMNLAMILGAPIGTVIGGAYGWRATFLAIAVWCVLGLLLVLRTVPDVPRAGSGGFAQLGVLRSRGVLLAIAVTAVGNAGLLAVFTYLAPLLVDVSGFAPGAVPLLLLAYGVGATVGNLAGGRLADLAPRIAQPALLAALAVALVALWAVSANRPATVGLVVLVGALGFAVVPGMQTRVLAAASSAVEAAPTLAIAVNASAYQLAAAFAGWFGGLVLAAGWGAAAIALVAAAVTLAGAALSTAGRATSESPLPAR
ncbi:MFS transporter [Pseudonocardia sp. TRM90224]|uniref:MFS transporter n=1 Tax=Pseudonocardia sp. TRM90224 TaxID=2812678 RepID=UPI001E4D12BC|nr:MFS transporter [Pseudonocardia sp. TRM90224]